MPFLIFSGDDYYPAGGWDDFKGSFATAEEACAAGEKLRGDWLHIVDAETLDCNEFRYAKRQWLTPEEAREWESKEAAKAQAKFDRTHVKLPPGVAYCGDCKIGSNCSWCSCGKHGKGEAA